jgi:hypothetical protein
MNLPSRALFEGDRGTVERLFSFAGVEPPDALEVADVLGTPHNQQLGGAPVRSPAEWSREERHAVNAIVEPVAGRLGYGLL